jgi:hypothetical protein
VGNHQENMQDMVDAGRQSRGADSGNAKLTEAEAYEIRSSAGLLREIACVYGITETAVSLIKLRKNWRHLA